MSSEDNPVELLSVVQFSSDSDTVTYLSRPDNGAGEAIQHSQPDGPSEDSEDKDRQLTSKSKLYHKVKEFVGCGDPSGGGSAELKKELTVLSGVAFITGNIIGSGIYIAPRKIFENTGSFGLTMVVWLIGAIIALVGGLCYIELAAVVRKSGGEYSILLTAYSFNERNVIVKTLGRVIAFLYAWSTVVVVRSISCSIILLTCARYFSRPFYIDCEVPRSVVTTLALALLLLVALVNARSVKFTARVMTVLSSLKVIALVFITLVGITYIIINGGFPLDAQHPFTPKPGNEPSVFTIAVAMYGVNFAYDGWVIMNYAVEETKDVGKTLPRSVLTGVPIVTVCYLLVNIAYFGVLCYDEVLDGDATALVFGYKALGRAGLVVIPLMVAVSTFGASMANVFGGSRVIFASARDGLFPQALSGLHKTYQTPIPAIMLQALLASVGIVVGDISSLLDGHSAVVFVFFFFVFVSVFILRVTHRHIKRPFPAWFILPVAGFAIMLSLFLIVFPIFREPKPLAVAYTMVLSGLLVYPVFIVSTPWKRYLTTISGYLTDFVSGLFNLELPKSPSTSPTDDVSQQSRSADDSQNIANNITL